MQQISRQMQIAPEELDELLAVTGNLASLKKEFELAVLRDTTRILAVIFAGATQLNVSDIHL